MEHFRQLDTEEKWNYIITSNDEHFKFNRDTCAEDDHETLYRIIDFPDIKAFHHNNHSDPWGYALYLKDKKITRNYSQPKYVLKVYEELKRYFMMSMCKRYQLLHKHVIALHDKFDLLVNDEIKRD